MSTKQLLTHSRMQSFKGCRKRHFFEYEVGIRKDTDPKALRMGSAGHEALDVLKMTDDPGLAIESIQQFYANIPFEGDDDWYLAIERETMETLIAGYAWRWHDQPFNVVASEQAFDLPLRNPETNSPSTVWDAAGKIDGIIEWDQRHLVLEHKFISDEIDAQSDYWQRLQLDSQISLYVWAARQLGHDVSGVLYDVIRKPTIKPTQVPILDENGLKIVLDQAGNRVYGADKTKKVPVLDSDGKKIVLDANGDRVLLKSGKPKQSASSKDGESLKTETQFVERGKPRQTGDNEKGWVVQTRRMTVEEWSTKLLADIEQRPEFYYARHEIARLDADVDEMMAEMWDIQKTIREAQRAGRWFKTVSRDTCTFCAFFGLCTSRFNPDTDDVPEGFTKLDDVHPELERNKEPV